MRFKIACFVLSFAVTAHGHPGYGIQADLGSGQDGKGGQDLIVNTYGTHDGLGDVSGSGGLSGSEKHEREAGLGGSHDGQGNGGLGGHGDNKSKEDLGGTYDAPSNIGSHGDDVRKTIKGQAGLDSNQNGHGSHGNNIHGFGNSHSGHGQRGFRLEGPVSNSQGGFGASHGGYGGSRGGYAGLGSYGHGSQGFDGQAGFGGSQDEIEMTCGVVFDNSDQGVGGSQSNGARTNNFEGSSTQIQAGYKH